MHVVHTESKSKYPRTTAGFSFGILGKKVGMTQYFSQENGDVIPVTVLEVGPCVVLQKKTI